MLWEHCLPEPIILIVIAAGLALLVGTYWLGERLSRVVTSQNRQRRRRWRGARPDDDGEGTSPSA